MPAVTVGRENPGDIEICYEDHGTERQVMQDCLDTLVKRGDYPACLTGDVAVTIEGAGQRAGGREPAGQLIRYFHQQAFDPRPELKNLLTEPGKAAIDAGFAGAHTGEFAGISATGKAVHVPCPVLYDLSGDQIGALRISFPVNPLMERLTS